MKSDIKEFAPGEGFIFDTSRMPIFLVVFPPRKTSIKDWQYYIDIIEGFFKDERPFVWVIDITDAGIQDPKLMYKTAVWVNTNKEFLEKYCLGTAYIVKNKIASNIARLFLSTLGAGKIMGPVEFFEVREEALIWANGLIKIRSFLPAV